MSNDTSTLQELDMDNDGGANARATDHGDAPEKGVAVHQNQKRTSGHGPLPGSSALHSIPPTDSPEYRKLQQLYGTGKFLGEL